jgi:hypothetical protein
MKKFYTSTLLALFSLVAFGQTRYLSEVFTDAQISVTTNVPYAVNLSLEPLIISNLTGQPPVPPGLDTLLMDIYQPNQINDNVNARPLVIYVPTGNFLPPGFNGSPVGNRKDSSAVNIAKQMAKRGYVVAVIDYRLGWNPVATDQVIRTGTILNAAYKGQQDSKAAVRFFRKDAATDNLFKIDPSKVALLGEGTGGYITMAHAYLDKPWKIGRLPGLGSTKFLRTINPDSSVIDTLKIGNFDGTNFIAPDGSLLAQTGNLLNIIGNIPNNPQYPSNVQCVINLGGALGDTSWIDPGQVPLISLHAVRDPNAPYDIGDVIVTTTGNLVIPFASGSGFNISRFTALGNNNSFQNKSFNDPVSLRAESLYNTTLSFDGSPIPIGNGKGLYPFILPENPVRRNNHGSPWQFWNSNQPSANFPVNTPLGTITTHQASIQSNPFMAQSNEVGRSVALQYIDTAMQFINPRLVCALGLAECDVIGIQKTNNLASSVSIYPNPANELVYLSLNNHADQIEWIKISDLTGRTVDVINSVNQATYTYNRQNLSSGIYLFEIKTNKGIATVKSILN